MGLEAIHILVSERVDKTPDAVFERAFVKARDFHILCANSNPRDNKCGC